MGAEAGTLGEGDRIGQAAPERALGLLFRLEAAGAHEPVAVAGPAVLEGDLMDHAVAVEGVIAPQRLVDLVFGIAQVDPVDVRRDGAFDDVQILGIHLLVQGRPGPVEIGVVAGLQGGEDRGKSLDIHARVSRGVLRAWAYIASIAVIWAMASAPPVSGGLRPPERRQGG